MTGPVASAAPGLADWSFDPALVAVAVTGVLYALGSRRTVTPPRRRREQIAHSAYFYTALAVLVIALNSPLEKLSEQLFWAHMIQHVLLLVVAPPLIVLARPWLRLWRALPLTDRRLIGRAVATSAPAAPLRALSRTAGRPAVSLILFSVVLLGWHVPALFDATLRSSLLHVLEHVLFFTTALLFFKQVIPSAPLRAPLPEVQRAVYVVIAMVVCWALAVVLALEPHALYASYAHEASRPGGISALADQQVAAGIMWVPGSVSFLIVLFVQIQRWLSPPSNAHRPSRLAGEH